jgi:hydroxymethylbilane synthase
LARSKVLKLGTRGSALALAQSERVSRELESMFQDLAVEKTIIKTSGDKILDSSLSMIGGKGLFTKAIEEALLERRIDFAVHSLKDLPTEIPEGLDIGAVLKRDSAQDCLVSVEGWTLKKFPKGARIGTSSLRRKAQLLALRRDWEILDLRGNIDTRMRKVLDGEFEAVVVAQAGIERLAGQFKEKWKELHVNPIPFWEMLPAAAQGFLAVEVRKGDSATLEFVYELNHPASRTAAYAERAFLSALQGGCQVPAGAYAVMDGAMIQMEGFIASLDGKKVYRESSTGSSKDAEKIGKGLAQTLLTLGGEKILEQIRRPK